MSAIILSGENAPRKLNELAREQMKKRLLADILMDMEICKLEGWSVIEHLQDIVNLLKRHIPQSNEGDTVLDPTMGSGTTGKMAK